MKVKLETVINNISGAAFKNQRPGEDEPTDLTVKDVMIGTLLNAQVPGAQEPGEDKYKRWRLATKINEAEGEVELSAEDIGLIKKLANHGGWSVSVYGRLVESLEALSSEGKK